jgi:hypothetical protein
MSSCTALAITLLYALGGIFPVLGIGLAAFRVGRPAIAHLARQKHVQVLRSEYQQRESNVTTQPERDALEEWMNAELSEKDKNGVAYNHSDAVLFGYSPVIQQTAQFKEILRDLVFVGVGVVSATAASIWSVWASMP